MAADAEALQHRSLFGGAIEVCLPARFVDISDVRPVPNNQEARQWSVLHTCNAVDICGDACVDATQVFADANRDQSFVVEIVVRVLPCLHNTEHRVSCSTPSMMHYHTNSPWCGASTGAQPCER